MGEWRYKLVQNVWDYAVIDFLLGVVEEDVVGAKGPESGYDVLFGFGEFL
jgi:hypothetical protein